jgi:hypothetical protein
MTLYEFIALNETDKANAVREGKFVGLREHQGHSVLLYRIGDFFCEVYYVRLNNAIKRLKPLKKRRPVQSFFS